MKINLSDEQIKCGILELAYMQMISEKTGMESNYTDVLPRDWIISKDYEQKMKILGEAIDKGINIYETEKYQKATEGKQTGAK